MSTREIQVWKENDGLVSKGLKFVGITQGEFLSLLATLQNNPQFVPFAHDPDASFVFFSFQAIYRSAFEAYVVEITRSLGFKLLTEPLSEA